MAKNKATKSASGLRAGLNIARERERETSVTNTRNIELAPNEPFFIKNLNPDIAKI